MSIVAANRSRLDENVCSSHCTGSEARMQAVNRRHRHLPAPIRPRLESLFRQNHRTTPYCSLSPSPPPPQHDALRRQVLRDCSQGSEIAEVGRPQDLLADASSSCVQRAACLLRVLTAAFYQVELGSCAKPGAIARVQWMRCVKM